MPKETTPQRLSGDVGYGQSLRLFSQYSPTTRNLSKLIVRYKQNASSRENSRETGFTIVDHSILNEAKVVNDFQKYIHFMWSYDDVQSKEDRVRKTDVKNHIEYYKKHFHVNQLFSQSTEYATKRKELEARVDRAKKKIKKKKIKNKHGNTNDRGVIISLNGVNGAQNNNKRSISGSNNSNNNNEDEANGSQPNIQSSISGSNNNTNNNEDEATNIQSSISGSNNNNISISGSSEDADVVAAKAAVVEKFYETFDKNNEKQTLDLLPGYNFPAIDKDDENPPDEIFCQIILRKKFMNEPEQHI